jgi:hypothetical protein
MDNQEIIKELDFITALCDELKQKCHKARELLGGVSLDGSPAPSGGKSKKLSQAEVINITTKRRLNVKRSMNKKAGG